MDNYWSATHDYLKEHGGHGPRCDCGAEMVAEDDHGRFVCFKCGRGSATGPVPRLPTGLRIQVTEDLPEREKAKIHPLNRLNLPPTEAESEMLTKMIRGEDYSEAMKRVDDERSESK